LTIPKTAKRKRSPKKEKAAHERAEEIRATQTLGMTRVKMVNADKTLMSRRIKFYGTKKRIDARNINFLR